MTAHKTLSTIFMTISTQWWWSKPINITSKLCGSFTLVYLCRQIAFEIQNQNKNLRHIIWRHERRSHHPINKKKHTDKIQSVTEFLHLRFCSKKNNNIKYGYFGIEIRMVCCFGFYSIVQIVSDRWKKRPLTKRP